MTTRLFWTAAALTVIAAGCSTDAAPAESMDGNVLPTYNPETGRLERLTSDRNADGRVDTWAVMDGRRLVRIEIDRDGDGAPDRVEHYETPAASVPGAPFDGALIAKAEESAGLESPVNRREFYQNGVLLRVEEDVDRDGRIDKWEEHEDGRLVRVSLDLGGRGAPNRRLIYGPQGVRVEVDPDFDGVFELAPDTVSALPEARP
jgi:hypothetical protein